MQYIIIAFATIFLCSASLPGEEMTRDQELECLLQKGYLEPSDEQDVLVVMVNSILQKTKSAMTVAELLERLKEKMKTAEVHERYLAILGSELTDDELKNCYELLQNPLYLKYRQAIDKANYRCQMETRKLLTELAQFTPAIALETTQKKGQEVIELTKETIDSYLKNSHFLIIDVYTDWCSPCKALKPIFMELNNEYGTRYTFAKLNAETNPSVSDQFAIEAYPTILFFKNGQEVGRHIGYINKQKFTTKIQEIFK